MLNIHARNLTVCTWLKDILKSNWCHAILVKGNCTFNYRREIKYWTWKLRASQILISLCVCISTYLCVYSVCFHMHTHPSVKLFDVIWKTRISWQGYFSILLLQLLSVPYMLYNLYFCKEIYPCARGIQEQPNSVRNKVLVFLGQLINSKYKFRASCCISRISQSRSDFEPLFYSHRFKCKNWLNSWCSLEQFLWFSAFSCSLVFWVNTKLMMLKLTSYSLPPLLLLLQAATGDTEKII